MSSVEDLASYLENLKLVNVQLKMSIQIALSNNEAIWKRIHIKEQQYFLRHIEIFGVPQHINEDCYSIVQNIGSVSGVELKVINAYRKLENVNGRLSKIVAELEIFAQKKKLINMVKQKGLYAIQLNETWPATRIFVNNFLTPHYRDLFYKSRLLGKMKHFKFIWYCNMEIRAQKDERSDIIRIQTHSDLSKIV